MIASLRGSHSASARRAERMKSSRPNEEIYVEVEVMGRRPPRNLVWYIFEKQAVQGFKMGHSGLVNFS